MSSLNEQLYHTVPAGIFQCQYDDALTLINANQTFYSFLGYTPAQFAQYHDNMLIKICHIDDVLALSNSLPAVLQPPCEFTFESRLICLDGTVKWVLITAKLIENQQGEPIFLCNAIDITKHKKIKEIWESTQFEQALDDILTAFYQQLVKKSLVALGSDTAMMNITFDQTIDGLKALFRDYLLVCMNYTSIDELNNPPNLDDNQYNHRLKQQEAAIQYQQTLQQRFMDSRSLIASSKVNLTKNKINFIHASDQPPFDVSKMTYEDMFAFGQSTIANPDDRQRYTIAMHYDALLEAYHQGKTVIAIEFRRKDDQGQLTWALATTNLIKDVFSDDIYAYGTIRDINEQKNREQALLQRAEKDSLTGAYHHDTGWIMMDEQISELLKTKQSFALVIFSLDNYDALLKINGEPLTNYMLKELHALIQDEFGASKIISRFGNHQFVVLLSGFASEERIIQGAEHISKTISTLYMFSSAEMPMSLSTGIAFSDTTTVDFNKIYHQAQAALLATQISEKNDCLVFNAPETATDLPNDDQHQPASANSEQYSYPDMTAKNLLLRCAYALAGTQTFATTIYSVLEQIGHHYKASHVRIIEINLKGIAEDATYTWQKPDALPAPSLSKAVMAQWFDIAPTKPVIIMEDIVIFRQDYPQEFRTLTQQGIENFYLCRLMHNHDTLGYMMICNPSTLVSHFLLLEALSYFIIDALVIKHLQAQHNYLLHYDDLTGLLNRSSYLQYRATLLSETLISLGIASFDINGLKQMNDEFGQEYGDKMVMRIADILLKVLKTNMIFRLSGDEFLAICENITHDAFLKLIKTLGNKMSNIQLGSAAIGYAWADTDISLDKLIREADEKMLISKQDYYRYSDRQTKHHNPVRLKQLLASLEKGLFVVYLQPKADIQTNNIIGAEALVRILHPKTGIIYPDKFIPQLEKEGLIQYVDLYIFEEVCRIIKRWLEEGRKSIVVSLNFSRNTVLADNVVETMIAIHSKYQVPRELIEIEITESIGEVERQTIARIGRKIVAAGFRLSLDDFGSKYSNISVLSAMELHVLKLDKSLVNDLFSNESAQIIIKNILNTCRDLNIASVAEGIENIEQLEILKNLGCDFAQGYYLNKPIPLATFEKIYLDS